MQSITANTLAERPIPAPKPAVMPPSVRLSLRANFLWNLAGNVVYTACQWGMLVALAKLGDAEMVGQFALALAVTAPVFMFTNLHLRGIQATDARGEHAFGQYLGLRLLMTAAALAVIAGLAVGIGATWTTAAVIVVIGIAKAAEAVSDVYYGLLQKHERMDRIAISMTAKGILSLLALAVTVYLTQSMLWGAVALALSWIAVLAMYDLGSVAGLCSDTATPRWHARALWTLARIALPLGVVMFLVSFTANVPRYFIEHFQGLGELGIFAAISYMVLASNRVLCALGESISPRMAKDYAAGDTAALRALLIRLVVFGAFLGGSVVALALVAGREVLTLFYRAEYAEHVSVFVWVAVGGIVANVASALTYGMTATRYFFVQAPMFLAAGLVTAAACAWLVPAFDLVGAAWAVAIGQAVLVVGGAVVMFRALARKAR